MLKISKTRTGVALPRPLEVGKRALRRRWHGSLIPGSASDPLRNLEQCISLEGDAREALDPYVKKMTARFMSPLIAGRANGRARGCGPSPAPVRPFEIPASSELIDVLPFLGRLALVDSQLGWRMLLAFGLVIVSKAAGLLAPLYFKQAVDALSTSATSSAAPIASISIVSSALVFHGIARAVNSLAKESQAIVFTPVAQLAGRRISFYALSHVLGLDLFFHLGKNSGTLSRMLERGSRSIAMIFRAVVFTFMPTLIELVAVCFILYRSFDWRISGIVVATFAGYFMWTVGLTMLSTKIRREVKNLDNKISGRAVDALLNVEAVKLSGAERYEVETYDETLARYQKATVRLEIASASLNCGQAVVLAVGMTACLIAALHQPMMSAGDLVMIQGLLIQLWAPLQFLGWFYRELRQSLVDMEDLFVLMRTDTKVPEGTDELHSTENPVRIQLRNVEFRYPGTKRRVLKGIDITAQPGESIAIVGPSGSGKSTLLRLLVRMYDPINGSVEIDGMDVRDLTSRSLRSCVAVVPQDTVLFNDTMLHNVMYGNMDASPEEVLEAVRAAKLTDAVDRMPEGWRTPVGERGLKLSGGEKQRVAIARAFLKKPRLLIADEATSALDSATEIAIMRSLEELAVNRTSVFVAHRLSTIQQCDRIYVLADGVVREQGSHEQLMQAKGLYHDMWQAQAQQNVVDQENKAIAAMSEAFGE
jgi:ABC-type transport system involved in Fe-S cluster assembly fused permease/ATPase subunit